MTIERRSFLAAAMAAFPSGLAGQSAKAAASAKGIRVGSGEGRLGEHHAVGLSTTAFKVLTSDSGGGLFVMEHEMRGKGGPPRHLHHNEDEWFYVLEGDYVAEIGNEHFRLKAGDSIFGPRGVPHVWAHVGDSVGRLLVSFAPANKMEAYFRDTENRSRDGEYLADAAVYQTYGLELLGPPLTVG